jgi:hypothetical protein
VLTSVHISTFENFDLTRDGHVISKTMYVPPIAGGGRLPFGLCVKLILCEAYSSTIPIEGISIIAESVGAQQYPKSHITSSCHVASVTGTAGERADLDLHLRKWGSIFLLLGNSVMYFGFYPQGFRTEERGFLY